MFAAKLSRSESMGSREPGQVLLLAVLLVIAAIVAYANSFSVPLLFDDFVTIQNNPRLRQVWPLWAALSPPEYSGVGGRPIANLSFVLNYALTGESVPGFHAVNLAIHFLAALTLFAIVRRTLLLPQWRERFQRNAAGLALAVAGMWMLHPVQTQSVTYVSQRTESLMGLFYLFTLYAFIRGATSGRSRAWFVAALASCLAGMATKEGMVTIPVIILLYDFVFLSRSFTGAWKTRWPVHVALASSWVLLAVLMSGLKGRGVGFGLGMSWFSYLLIECRAIVQYLSLALWPEPLVFDYGVEVGNPGATEIVAAAVVVGLGIGTLAALWRAPAIGFLGAWFFITLSPTSSIVPIPLQPISENRVYVPTIAVLTGLVLLVHSLAGRRGLRACYVAATIFIGLTALRNRDYRSEIQLWTDTVAKRPDSSRAHSNLGYALQSTGRLAEAKKHHEIALRLRPDYAEAHVNLAALSGQMGLGEEALKHSRRATEIDPRNPNAFFNLGVALSQKGDVAGAISAYESAIALGTASAEAHSNLALLLVRVGRSQEALVHSETALRLKPGLVLGHYSLACALALVGRVAESIPHFQTVIRAQPNHLEAHQNFGAILLQLGKPAEALPVYEAATRISPTHAAVRFGFANALLLIGRVSDAIREFENTARLGTPSAELHQNYGLALAKAGRTADAIAQLEAALRMNPQLQVASETLARLRGNPVQPPKP